MVGECFAAVNCWFTTYLSVFTDIFDFRQQFDLYFSVFLSMFYLCKHRVQEQSKILQHRGSNTNGILHI